VSLPLRANLPLAADVTVASARPLDRLRWRLVRAYMHAELPAWGRLYAWAGGNDAERWRHAPTAVMRGKLHGYRLQLDLSNWSERLSYCLGRYHDLPIQALLHRVLQPGDCFVDIGANLGHMSLLARSCVGDQGRVLACEPNPELVQRLQATFADNGFRNVDLVACAVGAATGSAELREYAHHSGWGSLSAVGPQGAVATHHWTVAMVAGDDLLARVPYEQPIVIKIDVEGHEVPVLTGLQHTLAERLPLVLLEVADEHQRRAGYSEALLRAPLEQLGYSGYAITAARHGLRRRRLGLQPIGSAHGGEVDAVFVPPRGPLRERMGALFG